MKKSKTTKTVKSVPAAQPKDKLLPKLTMAFFKRTRTTAMLWLIIAIFGVLSYTTFLKREGFPSVAIPLVIVSGSYAVDDPSQVDKSLAEPISAVILKQDGVTSVTTTSDSNFFSAIVVYEENVDTKAAGPQLEKTVRQQVDVPDSANLSFSAPYFGVTGGDERQIDATISLYKEDDSDSLELLTAKAEALAKYLNQQNLSQAKETFVQSPFKEVTNPATSEKLSIQRTFDAYGTNERGVSEFHKSVIIGVTGSADKDVIKLDQQLEAALAKADKLPEFRAYGTAISASNGPQIRESISELQSVLLEGLLAVLIIGSIVIAVRASIITVISMLTVIAATVGLLFLLGYTLNVITLFAIILGLSLIVDDTIIMVEALDASRKREKTAKAVVRTATRKISRAMVAATLTAALSFTPLLFVGGILGSFIRAIPVTIISALLISLVVALVFIPLFAKFILLGKKQLGKDNVREVAAGVEERIARALSRPMLWAQHHRKREFGVGISAVVVGLLFIVIAGFIFTKVTFNIFPPTKDSNMLALTVSYLPDTKIERAEALSDQIDAQAAEVLGEYFVNASYYGLASAQTAILYINITPYTERDVTSLQLVDKLNDSFKNYSGNADIKAAQVDVGPPSSGFTVNIEATDRAASEKVAADMAKYLEGLKLTRPSGEVATMKDSKIQDISIYKRTDNTPVLSVTANFDGTDTTTLTTLAQDAVKKEFDAKRLTSYGLSKDAINFDIGEEQSNQDSFKTLALAFPVVLLVIYLLLSLQFRSLLQPLLIFMAIPFSLFGVTLGLYLTDNAFSFFAMLGFFALIGLSIKNTILLTDYANQARRAGMSPIDAAVAAVAERFRPLIATSLTAIFSLIPLALTSPFWQGLAVVLIFGLASSTLLVVTVFPYYYLGAEYLRMRISRTMFFKWLAINVAVFVLVNSIAKNPAAAFAAVLGLNVGQLIAKRVRRNRTAS